MYTAVHQFLGAGDGIVVQTPIYRVPAQRREAGAPADENRSR